MFAVLLVRLDALDTVPTLPPTMPPAVPVRDEDTIYTLGVPQHFYYYFSAAHLVIRPARDVLGFVWMVPDALENVRFEQG